MQYRLLPFPGLPFPQGVRVEGAARRAGATLHLNWSLAAPTGAVVIPPEAVHLERRRDLWEDTCFECFLATSSAAPASASLSSSSSYWEFNLSPAGHWNVFRFDSYRAGMRDEMAFEDLPFSVDSRPQGCEISVRIDTSPLGCGVVPWSLGIAAVIAEPGGRRTYWALSHPGTDPDFHHPSAFLLNLG